MQYLAEVRKTKAFVGEKAELKLLAKNTAENNWLAINVEQVVAISDPNLAKDFKDGQLALADLVGTNNEIKSIQDASRRLVQTLQNFGKLQDRFKQGEQEIEQWKQSLTFQTQDIQRREIEIEERERELDQLENRKEEIEAQVEQFDREKAEVQRLRDEIRAKESEFADRATAISADQAQELRDLVKQLSSSTFDFQGIQTKIATSLETIYARQDVLNGFWRDLESQKTRVNQTQQETEAAKRNLEKYQQEWQQIQNIVNEAQVGLKFQKEQLQPKENIAQLLRTGYQSQMELYHNSTEALTKAAGSSGLLSVEEVKRLEDASLPELEQIIANSQVELDKSMKFVNAQEEELVLIEEEIAEVAEAMEKVQNFERMELEAKKESLEEEFKAQDESLQGQRRGIQDRESILEQQRRILDKRNGVVVAGDPVELFRPIVMELNALTRQSKEFLETLERQLESDRLVIKQQDNLVNEQKLGQQRKQQEVRSAEEQLFEKIKLQAEAEGNSSSLERILRPLQDIIDVVRPNLESARDELAKASSGQDAQPIVSQLEQKINALIQ